MMIPIFLSELVRAIVMMSLSGGLLIVLLLLMKPAVRHRLPKLTQYCFWLVALVVLLIPIGRMVSLPSAVANIAPIQGIVERNVISTTEAQEQLFVEDARNVTVQDALHAGISEVPLAEGPGIATRAVTVFMALYLPIAGLVLLYSLLGYARFIKKLHRSSSAPHPSRYDMLLILTDGKRTPRLIMSEYAATPMLIGVLRPTIVLPKKAYSNEQLQSILLHELAHMRRFDVAVKWLTLLACAVHWFNPFVWAARREIDHACELSCDEVVISGLDTYGKQHYGDTLISLASNKKIPLPVLSTTMCAEKRALKERLSAIMKSKKYTKLTLLLSAIIFLAVTLTACAVAAGSNLNPVPTPELPTNYQIPADAPESPPADQTPDDAPETSEASITTEVSPENNQVQPTEAQQIETQSSEAQYWTTTLTDRGTFTFSPTPDITAGNLIVVQAGTVVTFRESGRSGARFGYAHNLMLTVPDLALWEEALFTDAPHLSDDDWDFDLSGRLRENIAQVLAGGSRSITLTEPGFYVVGLEGEFWLFVEVVG